MITENIFEYATKNRLRFPYKGSQSVEDLWALSVEELDKLFKTLKWIKPEKAKINPKKARNNICCDLIHRLIAVDFFYTYLPDRGKMSVDTASDSGIFWKK